MRGCWGGSSFQHAAVGIRARHRARPIPQAPWRVSAIVTYIVADLAAYNAFNASAARTRAVVDAIECRPKTINDIALLADGARGLDVYIEIPGTAPTALWMHRIASLNLRAKIRTGGVTAEAFPSPAAVVAFIAEALRAGVTSKLRRAYITRCAVHIG